ESTDCKQPNCERNCSATAEHHVGLLRVGGEARKLQRGAILVKASDVRIAWRLQRARVRRQCTPIVSTIKIQTAAAAFRGLRKFSQAGVSWGNVASRDEII